MCFASVATIPAAYMLPTRYSWRLFFYVVLAFAFVLVLAVDEHAPSPRVRAGSAAPSLLHYYLGADACRWACAFSARLCSPSSFA